jgi:hypothetical protein
MMGILTRACLQSLVNNGGKAKARHIPLRGLLGVSNPKLDMIITVVLDVGGRLFACCQYTQQDKTKSGHTHKGKARRGEAIEGGRRAGWLASYRKPEKNLCVVANPPKVGQARM